MPSRPTPPPAAAGSNVDRARQVLGDLGRGKKPVKKSTPEKVKLELPPALQPAFVRFAGNALSAKTIEKAQEQEKEPLLAHAFDVWIDKLWGAKTRPATMQVEVRDNQGKLDSGGNYIVQGRYSITLPDPKEQETREEAAIKAIAASLHGKGMDEEEAEGVATRFVNTELDLALKPTINLDKWFRGREEGKGTSRTWVEASPEEQDMAARLVLILKARNAREYSQNQPLTDEELDKVIEYEYKPVVRSGFLERVASYVHSKDQLKVLFTFVKPVNFFSGLDFAQNSSPQEKIERQVDQFREMIGIAAAAAG